MAEFRHDPVHRRWVLVTVDRSLAPRDFVIPPRGHDEGICPFCEGQESKTPPEIYALRTGAPDRPGWKIRVFPNKYPVLDSSSNDLQRKALGQYDWVSGFGSHEIVVDHPRHLMPLHEMGRDHLASLIETYRQRMASLTEEPRYRYFMLFKNHRAQAGASVNHSHTQIISMPVIPRIAAMALSTAREHFHHKERCLFCDLVNLERSDGRRVVAENEHFVCFVPYASRFAFEMAIFPKVHHHDFATMHDDLLGPCAAILEEAVKRLAELFGDPPFNIIFHTAPNPNQASRRANYWGTLKFDWHWHIEIVPRLEKTAGFEWGTGLFINHTPPEDAAAYLRRDPPKNG
ncbi:MAG: galactose-1-phosphate uridylyltransferase [Candidatus Glassbacteria bacterium]|nr:galactose-1-phosphate uridylyltransferase [Candidatus Glassbacteria bacterium]